MSIVRNRELSQFGSFIYIDNSSREIGIATEATPYVGIGTTNPTVKLEVVGDTNIQGNFSVIGGTIESSSYTLNGNPLVDATVEYWILSENNTDVYREIGNIGIGSTIPSSKLDVIGDVKVSGITTSLRFSSTVATGTAPLTVNSQTLVTNLNADFLRGKVAPSGNIVGTTDTQTLTNKTLTSPSVTSPTITSGGLTINGSTSGSTLIQASAVASGTLTLPTQTGTLVSTGSVGAVTSTMIADGTIVNSDISNSAAIAISKLASSTISGVSLGNNLNNLTAGSFINYNSGSTYNGSSAITVSVNATSSNTADTVVARNASGDFSAGSISCANLTASFTVQAADFNSTSDENLKTNIETVQDPLDTLQQLRGVTFDWKESQKPSVGVIAQELEQVLPQLVNQGDYKSVNYNGLIGVLIEAVKELSQEVEELKRKVL